MQRFLTILLSFILSASGLILWMHQDLLAAENSNSSCIACHTNLKKLIRLCWKIEDARPKSLKSSETSGEG